MAKPRVKQTTPYDSPKTSGHSAGLGGSAPLLGLSPLLQFESHLLNAWPGLLQIKAQSYYITLHRNYLKSPIVKNC